MTHMRGHGGFGANVDPSTLPQTKGIIAQFVISPRGDVEALLLADGTEVHVMPQAGAALAAIVKPNDAITIRGLKARSGSMIMAVSITNDATGLVAGGNAMRARMDANGVVKSLLHTPRGDVNGAVLADGTVLRLPPQEAERRAGLLAADEQFAVDSWRTKLVFALVQLAITVATLLLAWPLFYSRELHEVSLLLWFVVATFNGSTFYLRAAPTHAVSNSGSVASDE
jgi:hypothetical protein